jgi:hypothetical protein
MGELFGEEPIEHKTMTSDGDDKRPAAVEISEFAGEKKKPAGAELSEFDGSHRV